MAESLGEGARHSVRLKTDYLVKEMALRGWNQNDLAGAAEISQPTVSAAVRGETVSPATAKAIYEAFEKNPPTLGDLVVAQ